MTMEKRNLIEEGRTPGLDKQAEEDAMEKDAVASFKEAVAPKKLTKPKCMESLKPVAGVTDIFILGGIFMALISMIILMAIHVPAKTTHATPTASVTNVH